MSTNIHEHVARSDKGIASEKQLNELIRTLTNPPNEAVAKDVEAMNERIRFRIRRATGGLQVTPETAMELIARELTVGDVQTTPVLQNFSQMYANDEYIGTRIMPVVPVPLGTGSASYWTHDQANAFTAPDDSIATGGTVNEVTEGLTPTSVTLLPRALQERLDVRVKAAMDAPVAQMVTPLLTVLDGLLLNQEVRIAAIAGVAGSYGANTAPIAALDRWSTAAGGDPGGDIDTAKAALFGGSSPSLTVGFCSLAVYNVLRRNPVILDHFKYTGRDVLGRRQLADYLELDELLVGAARRNTALPGVAAVYARIWPDVFGVVRVPRMPAVKVATFGITLEEPKSEMEWFEAAEGGWGAFHSKVAFADASVVVSNACGFLYTTPI
jgi:hypothetical protein